jgi:aerobic carbon-monoxide dehydrogenase medium subunit
MNTARKARRAAGPSLRLEHNRGAFRVKPASFAYHVPKSLDEALSVLAEVAPKDGRVLAGGQSLVPAMAFRLARPEHLVDINRVRELGRLAVEGNELVIGALVRHAAFQKAAAPGPLGALLSEVVRHIAHYPIRTRGTFCGSLAHADPASEWCAVAAALDAVLIARSTRSARRIAARDYFKGIMTTALAPDELLVEARLPLLPADARVGFYEFNRRAGDFAMAMAVVVYRIENGAIVDPRVAVGGVEDRPRRVAEAERALAGATPGSAAFAKAGDAAAAVVDPIEDAQTSAAYRRELAATVVRRALEQAAA